MMGECCKTSALCRWLAGRAPEWRQYKCGGWGDWGRWISGSPDTRLSLYLGYCAPHTLHTFVFVVPQSKSKFFRIPTQLPGMFDLIALLNKLKYSDILLTRFSSEKVFFLHTNNALYLLFSRCAFDLNVYLVIWSVAFYFYFYVLSTIFLI